VAVCGGANSVFGEMWVSLRRVTLFISDKIEYVETIHATDNHLSPRFIVISFVRVPGEN
jgi:hypothetical protein